MFQIHFHIQLYNKLRWIQQLGTVFYSVIFQTGVRISPKDGYTHLYKSDLWLSSIEVSSCSCATTYAAPFGVCSEEYSCW